MIKKKKVEEEAHKKQHTASILSIWHFATHKVNQYESCSQVCHINVKHFHILSLICCDQGFLFGFGFLCSSFPSQCCYYIKCDELSENAYYIMIFKLIFSLALICIS